MQHNIYSEIPKPPKGIGLSRRLLVTIAFGLLLIVILFLVFLNHYTPQPIKRINETSQGSFDSAISLIEKIQRQAHQPLRIASEPNNLAHAPRPGDATKPVVNPVLQEHVSPQDFKDAGNAAISVYQANPPAAETHTNSLADAIPPSEWYTNPADNPNLMDTYRQQNQHAEKVAFLAKHDSLTKNYLQSTLQRPRSPYQLNAGTLIPANLVTGINSNLPGKLIAKVRRNVYDSTTGNYLLIPQGTTLIGSYDSQVAYGQSRVLVVWSGLHFPDGSSLDLAGMPGVDLTGMTGLSDRVDNHYTRLFSSAFLLSLLGGAGQLSQPQNSNQVNSQQLIAGAMGQQMGQTATQLVTKNMNIQPTLTIRPGVDFNILLTKNLVLAHPYH